MNELYTEDIEELKAVYVRFDEAQTTDYYPTDDIFGWYDGVTHVSRETWDEYQRLRKEVASIEALMYKDIRFYSAEEGTRP